MSIVNIRNIQLLNNPARFDDEYQFRITFECVEGLEEDIEWKLLYVGDAKSEEYDQELDSCMVGPVPIGVNSFDFTCAPPQPSLLPSTSSEEILGVTVLILTASYRDKEFVRVGYYVNTEYEDEARRAEPPAVVDFTGLIRNVLVEKPRVTRFNNPWDSELKSNPWGSNAGDASGQAQGGNVGSEMAGGSGSMQDLDVGGKDLLLDSPLPPPVVAAVAGATSAAADVDMA
ncbi:histone chaperone ASF1 [Filobasidium floriforme]|uniref:histone chaperone ASF1 n=1 Tax=Filobasidium floriforme TaxID=5210 RepID=UPI001E8E5BC0|nr:histone chaperone ASF1 [Filobasidium floriforme]KAH8089780.1 histone chaperone ASF1 [Filobasidium floriforme]